MTTTIQGPDGALIDFPDNTPESEMNAAMAKAYPTAASAPSGNAMSGASRALENNLPFADRAVAGLKTMLPQGYGGTGQDYAANLAAERGKDQQFAQQNPVTNAVGGLTAYAPAALIGGGGGLLGRVGTQAAAGLGIGALQGASNSTDLTSQETGPSIAQGELSGGLLGAAVPVVASGIGKAISPLAAAIRGGPGTADIANLGKNVTAAYQRVNDLGAAYSPEAYQGLVDKIAADAQAARINPSLHPGASGVIGDMQGSAASGKPVDLPVLDQDRQIAWRDAASKPDAGEQLFGNKIRGNIDGFIKNAGPDQMASGAGPEAADAIQNARDLAMRQFKVKALTDALDKASVRADVTGSGGNIENTTRQRLAAILNKEPWSPDETAQLSRMVHGTPITNTLRSVSRLSPWGNGLNLMLEGGLAGMGNPAALPAAGAGLAAQAAGALARGNAKSKLLSMVIAGGQAPEAQSASPLISRAALAAALGGRQQLQRTENTGQ